MASIETRFDWMKLLDIGAFGILTATCFAAPLAISHEVLETVPLETVPLETKVHRDWKFRLPAESWKPIGKAIVLPGDGEDVSFRSQLDGTTLAIDCDADGSFDTRIDAESEAVVILVNGSERVALRVRATPDWSYAPASLKSCSIDGTKVALIDQNNNGRFDDFGEDAMVIGVGKTASFLSKVVSVKGKLYSLSVAKDASSLSYAPYEGPTSKVDFDVLTKGKVLAAILKSSDGSLSFDVSKSDGEVIVVPTASYVVHSGLLSFGGNQVSVRTGRAQPIALEADKTTELRFGGPVRVEFAYAVSGKEYSFSPTDIWYYGRAGEEYFDWQPLGKSPVIAIWDGVAKKKFTEVVFPPNC